MRAGKSPRRGHGHISTLHIWWARRPLAACRAVICAALWPDPADDLCPQPFRDAMARRGQREPQMSLFEAMGKEEAAG
jgi:putative DNA methylase